MLLLLHASVQPPHACRAVWVTGCEHGAPPEPCQKMQSLTCDCARWCSRWVWDSLRWKRHLMTYATSMTIYFTNWLYFWTTPPPLDCPGTSPAWHYRGSELWVSCSGSLMGASNDDGKDVWSDVSDIPFVKMFSIQLFNIELRKHPISPTAVSL